MILLSRGLLLIAIAFAPCQQMRLHVIKITGVLLKDGNPLPLSSKQELEDHSVVGQFEDVCIKRQPSVMGTQYEKLVNTEKIAGYKNFTCVVTGPRSSYVKGVFFMHFESDETDAITITKEALEKRSITGNGYDITALLIAVLNFTF
ncbi:unnamed protein product [Dicrocoelium dendriticum]|nr:unnamed protein product [Dicrocoelium dendriticum]